MNRLSKVLFSVIIFLVVLSVSATFYKAVILQDFEIIIIDHEEEEIDEDLSETPEETEEDRMPDVDTNPNTEDPYEEQS